MTYFGGMGVVLPRPGEMLQPGTVDDPDLREDREVRFVTHVLKRIQDSARSRGSAVPIRRLVVVKLRSLGEELQLGVLLSRVLERPVVPEEDQRQAVPV